jgi:hypothetical protein
MFCTQCGERLPDGARYCSGCGKELEGITAPEGQMAATELPKLSAEPPTPTKEDIEQSLQVRPWVRYWARMFDVALFSLPAGFLLGWFFPEVFMEPGSEHIIGVVLLFSWAFFEAVLLSTMGTTPGKALFRIKLMYTGGTALSYSDALARSLRVWWRGLGTGFPIVSLVTLIVAYNKLNRNRRASWDSDGGFIVQHEPIGAGRVLFAVAFFIAFFLLIVAGEAMNA